MKPKGTWSLLLLLALALAPPQARAADDAVTKLGRGMANVAFGWGEYIRQMEIVGREKGAGQGVFVGFIRGTCWTILRTGAGVYEIVTFPFKTWKGYEAVLKPDFVFSEVGTT